MARTGKPSAVEVAKAKGPAVLHDGGGLYLSVSATGAKSWVFRFQLDGKRRDMGLGPFPDISLAAARERRQSTGSYATTEIRRDRPSRRQGSPAASAAPRRRKGPHLPGVRRRVHREEPGRLAQREAPAAMGKYPRHLRLPHFGGIARFGDRYRPCCSGARSDLGREAGNREPGARPDRGGARCRDGGGLSARAEPGNVERQSRPYPAGPR